ncbi:hypothetical protein IEO21_07373 [Rhodonia placenta]|uniref:Uncharacterized protein n=1 Tax=Rhodonia placenta TaxID=104341 RepID=A0A8H7U0F3_9APHY|nr:hypothetical protein IEO21_07373 [Postia placenta]
MDGAPLPGRLHSQSLPQHPQHMGAPRSRNRSQSPHPGDRDYHHLPVPHHSHSHSHSRSRGSSAVGGHPSHGQLHPSASASGPGVSPPGSTGVSPIPGHGTGPLAAPGQVQTYQTHIFAPPVTGAPVKKSKTLTGQGSANTLSGNGSVLTLGKSPA